MTNYEFTLYFRLPDPREDPQRYLGRLADAGCEDALVGLGQPGRIALEFSRSAKSALAAIASALREVRRAIPGAVLVEAAPDLVGLSDVAEFAGFTRQNMRKLMLGNAASFPSPVHEGKPALWHLACILNWLQTQPRSVDSSLLEVAKAAMAVNIAKETTRLPGATLPRELALLFA